MPEPPTRRPPEGITVRHGRHCAAESGGRCRCKPALQAQTWTSRPASSASSAAGTSARERSVRDNDVGPRGTSRLGCPGQRDGSALSGFALLHAPEPHCLGNSEEGNRGEHGDDEAENVEFPDVPRPEEARHDTPNEGTENSE